MTAFAFILGVVPLMLASGAGSGAQNVMGTAVFWGMLVATALGVFIIPGNFAFVEGLRFVAGASARADAGPGGRAGASRGIRETLGRCCRGGAPAGRLHRGARLPRPTVDTPPDFRGARSCPSAAESLGDLRWWQIFPDETLQSLIRTALAENYDVRVAATRILEARAQVTIARSFQFPELSAPAAPRTRASRGSSRPPSPDGELVPPAGGLDLVLRDRPLGPLPSRVGGGTRRAARQRGVPVAS